jgi:hypothetical protein
MSRSEIGLNETPVAMMASSPTATTGGTSLVRPIARFASPHASSGSSDARVPLKKRAIRECFGGDDNEIPEPPRLRRQKVIHWRPSGFQPWGECADDHPISPVILFASMAADFQTGLDSKPTSIPQLGYNNKTTKSRGVPLPLFGVWSREPLFVDDDTDTEMELESFAKPHTTQEKGRTGWTEMQSFAITPSPHPMELAQSPLPFQVLSEHDGAPTSPVSPPPLQYYHDMDADADMGVLDQEGSDWFISSKMNELTRLHKHEYEHEYEPCEFVHEYDYAGGMGMQQHYDSSPDKSGNPLLAKLPGFPEPGGTIQDMMEELIIPTPDPTPPRDFGVHHLHHGHHRSSIGSNNDHYDPAISMMQHPGAYAATNGWFATNSSLSPARIDQANMSSFSAARIDQASNNDGINGNCDSIATAHAGGNWPLFWASNGECSSAFAPGQAREWYGAGYYNASA